MSHPPPSPALNTHTHTLAHTHTRCFAICSLLSAVWSGVWVLLESLLGTDVNSLWMSSALTQTCLSAVPQFGSCSSFGTFRPAFSHSGTIIRPLSVILPASPTFNHSPGSNTPSPTSKVPSWKVCFHLQFLLLGFAPLLKLSFFLFFLKIASFASCF